MKEKRGLTSKRRTLLMRALNGLLRELGWIGPDEEIRAEFMITRVKVSRSKDNKESRAR